MKHDEFQVERHRFGNEARALLRVDLRGAFYIQKSAFMRRQVLFIYRKEGGQEIEQSKIPNMNPCHWKN